MELSKVSRQFLTLNDGSCKILCCGEWECYSFVLVLLLKSKTTPYSIPITTGHQFVQTLAKNYLELGVKMAQLPDPGGSPYYKIAPTTKPQYRGILDSCTFDECGVFKPSHDCFGEEGEGPESVRVRNLLILISFSYTKAYVSWLSDGQDVSRQLFLHVNLYDLRATQFVNGKCGSAWVYERTMTRKMMQELEELISGPKVHYKGVRWRPERKHPWIAELKISKKKKMWIGAFRTQEDAARAYDVVAIAHGKQTTLNFQKSYQQVFDKPMEMSKTSISEQQVVTSCSSALNNVSTNFCYPPASNHDHLGPSFANHLMDLVHDFDESVLAATTNLDQDSPSILPNLKHLTPPQHTNLYNFEKVDSIQPCYMFAKDLPIIVDNSLTLFNPYSDGFLSKENTFTV